MQASTRGSRRLPRSLTIGIALGAAVAVVGMALCYLESARHPVKRSTLLRFEGAWARMSIEMRDETPRIRMLGPTDPVFYVSVLQHNTGKPERRWLMYGGWDHPPEPVEVRCERAEGSAALPGSVRRIWLIGLDLRERRVCGAMDLETGACVSGISICGKRTEFWVQPPGLTESEQLDIAGNIQYDGTWDPRDKCTFGAMPSWATVDGGELLVRFQ